MLDLALQKTEKKIDPVRVVLSGKREKPYDDALDYPLDLDPYYKVETKQKEDSFKTTA